MSYVEQRITFRGLSGLAFIRRPCAGVMPDDGWIGFVELAENGRRVKHAVGRWKDGRWDNGKGRELPFEPSHWTSIEDKS